ncbi:phosphatase PAP2 family protein [Flavobacterium cellulosilyticum]|uniref:Phosphatase PAP2 family protein n=1 Tax=Flavobacterium cellulosilyticum TaxID=2541731 RepID=A0A4R5CIF4_9FLAO|nr:phosphatase PAP2 family protein [Flavobacterium cellulosilyticum]TDD99565.1 phosphatase PAP2 family protein [Flavobacterium cellulosilyticum]
MLEKINHIDTELFLYLNSKHNTFFDPIMYWASDKLFWIPFYLFIIFLLIREYKKQSVYVLISIGILITLCDQIASHLIKNAVKRLRPSHEPFLEDLIHLSKAGSGGQYGFVSSHSANAFGLATFLILLLPKSYNPLKWVLGFWAFLVAYSRIYNGVHYPCDVIVAALIGILLAIMILKILKYKFLRSL